MMSYSQLPFHIEKRYSPFAPPFVWNKITNPLSSNRKPQGLKLHFVNGETKQVVPTSLPKNISKSPKKYTQELKQHIESKRLGYARDLYIEMKSKGIKLGVVPESVLIDAFMKSGWMCDAFQVFEAMPERNVVTWTSMISGCVHNGCPGFGFSLFVDMLESGVLPNDYTFNVALQACSDLAVLNLGEQVHSLVVRSGFSDDCRTGNCLIQFYSRCGLTNKAMLVFYGMPELDLVSFTSMISGFCRNNLFKSAVRVFDQMVRQEFEPNEHTITSILTACGPLLGEQIHGYMIKTMFDRSPYSASALIEFYSRHKEIECAKFVFERLEAKNVVTWTSMISSCLRNEQMVDALKIFHEMVCAGIGPNHFTFAIAIGACGLDSESNGLGRQLHCSVIKLNLMSDDHISNALLTMYARNGEIEELEKVFEKFKDPDVISWSAAISGYFQNGFYERSINILRVMHRKGYTPNEYGFSSALSSCANLALLDQGRQFHCLALKLGCDFDICTGNAVINMYAKCGSLGDARLEFDVMPTYDVTSWNSLIHGYSHHGLGKKAIEVFHEMESNHFMPDHSTFVGVLVGCSHVGCVDEAFKYFKIMDDHYGVTPSESHYACMVDMMGRAGRLSEAVHIIDQMPIEPDVLIWKTLLGSCRLHKNLELGKLAAEKVIELSPQDSASYVLLSNLHAMHGEWEDVERVRTMMEEKGVKKDAGWSWIEIRSEVHAFVASDKSHPSAESIYRKLEELMKEMKYEGYSPDMSFELNCL